LAVWILGGKGVVHEDKDKDNDKEEDKNKNKDKNKVVGHGRRILTSAADLGKGHEREIQIASSPRRLTVERNVHGKRRVIPRCVPRLEDLRTDDGAESVGDEHECEDSDFLGLAGCVGGGASVLNYLHCAKWCEVVRSGATWCEGTRSGVKGCERVRSGSVQNGTLLFIGVVWMREGRMERGKNASTYRRFE
jgi:hypothetical protein